MSKPIVESNIRYLIQFRLQSNITAEPFIQGGPTGFNRGPTAAGSEVLAFLSLHRLLPAILD